MSPEMTRMVLCLSLVWLLVVSFAAAYVTMRCRGHSDRATRRRMFRPSIVVTTLVVTAVLAGLVFVAVPCDTDATSLKAGGGIALRGGGRPLSELTAAEDALTLASGSSDLTKEGLGSLGGASGWGARMRYESTVPMTEISALSELTRKQ